MGTPAAGWLTDALATGCEPAIKPESPRYAEFRNDGQLLDLFLASTREGLRHPSARVVPDIINHLLGHPGI